MKIPGILLFLLFACKNSNKQVDKGIDTTFSSTTNDVKPLSEISDSLKKYSYPVFEITGKTVHTGTAFFYKADNKTFLVSNYHVIKGMSPFHRKILYSSDVLYLKCPITNSNEFIIDTIDISESKVGKTEIFRVIEKLDLFGFEIQPLPNASINYINDLIDTTYFNKIPDEACCYGYSYWLRRLES